MVDRQHYHDMLDRAMDATEEGDHFLPRLTVMILRELQEAYETIKREAANSDKEA